ncbi:MAG: hypothetical protein GY720_02120 [bacterium]|nr:hypothetical protein [bacterium]
MARISVLLIVLAALLIPTNPLAALDGSRHCDINGDGYDDLVAGDEHADGDGQITIIYGSDHRLDISTRHTISQVDIDAAVLGGSGNIGRSFDCGDINNDGYADVILGVPKASWVAEGGLSYRPGAIYALYGTADGLSTAGYDFYHRNLAGVQHAGAGSAAFGHAVALGDFDGDGYADVATGAPADTVDGIERAGSVHIFYGKATGLGKARDRVFDRGQSGIKADPETQDHFGAVLSVGDFNGDGYDDLAIGVPSAEVAGLNSAGEIHLLMGSAVGLRASGDRVLHRNKAGVKGSAEQWQKFGHSLTSGDFDGDGYDDLVVPLETRKLIHVFPGSPNGISTDGDYVLHRDQPGVAGNREYSYYHARNTTSGDLDGDGFDDFIYGSAGDQIHGVKEVGSVHVFYGSANGMSGDRDKRLHQDSPGIKGVNEGGDLFGSDTATGDYDGNGRADLAIVSQEDFGIPTRIAVVYSSQSGLTKVDQSFELEDFRVLGGVRTYSASDI